MMKRRGIGGNVKRQKCFGGTYCSRINFCVNEPPLLRFERSKAAGTNFDPVYAGSRGNLTAFYEVEVKKRPDPVPLILAHLNI